MGDIMGKQTIMAFLSTAAAIVFVMALGTDFAGAVGGTGYRAPEAPLNLNLTFADCTTCHTAPNNVARHHNLIAEDGRQCLDCHKIENYNSEFTVQVVRDCQQCHTSAMHDQVKHTIVTCSRCHGDNIGEIHAGRYATTVTVAACYVCHTSTATKVKATIAKGLGGQTVYCQDCHGNDPHSWGGMRGL